MKNVLSYALLSWVIALNINQLHASTEEHSKQDMSGGKKQVFKQENHAQTQLTAPKTKVQFICPMHPHIVGEEGDTCPICGMDLEPKAIELSTNGNYLVNLDGHMQQALGIRIAKAKRSTLWYYLSTLGTINYNESEMFHLHSRVSGWIEALKVEAVGDKVKKGQLLYTLYSPELVQAQEDYLLAIRITKNEPTNARYKELARKAPLKLALLGMSKQTINEVKRTNKSLFHVPFYAQSAGVIQTLNIREGMYIEPQTEMMTVVDLNSVWVIADLFEEAQSWIKIGQNAEINIPEQNIYRLEGKIDYIYPELDPQTRSLKVRIKLKNPEQTLKPNTFVEVGIFGGSKPKALTIPIESLIQTGKENRVIVQNHDGSFSVKQVKTGMVSQGKVEILEGITEGDLIVVSGQFLLDSEASLKGSLHRINAPEPNNRAHAGHQH